MLKLNNNINQENSITTNAIDQSSNKNDLTNTVNDNCLFKAVLHPSRID